MLAWCDILCAAANVFNSLPRPQSSKLALSKMSPDELASGVKLDLSTWIAAPGQLMALHAVEKKAIACTRTARLGLFICPSGGNSLMRDVSSWRLFVTFHAKSASSCVYGIAAQAIAVKHALNTSAERGHIGLHDASAGFVTQSAPRRALQPLVRRRNEHVGLA